jgi:hypothetical protein
VGVSRWSDGTHRHRRLVRAMGRASRCEDCAKGRRAALVKIAERVALLAGLFACGYIWCVLCRECDFEKACFQATFFEHVDQ